MQVAMLTTTFPRWEGDSRGPFVLAGARALCELGLKVRVITLHSPGAKPYERMDGLEVYRLRYAWSESWQILGEVGGGLPAAWRLGWRYRLMFGPMFLALVWGAFWHGRQADVVHAHWTLAGIAAWLMAPLTGRPFVLTVHGSDVFVAGRIPLVAGATRAMLRRCRHVFAVSQALRQGVIALGADPERVEVVPNGIDRTLFSPGVEAREPLVLFVGSLIPLKGVDVLLEAVAGLVQTIPAVRVALIGEGPERAALEAQAQRLGLVGRVTFIGPQTQPQVALWMRRARVFVLPSRQEGLGVVLLEALASGTPCVASRTGGIVDILTPETGILITPGQAQELQAALGDLLTDDRRWQTMSLAGRHYIETRSWTWPSVATAVRDVYRKVTVGGAAS